MRHSQVLIAAVLLAGCQSQARPLSLPAAAIHVVDGIEMTAEQPCNPTVEDWCGRWLRRARTALRIDADTAVSRIATAGPNGAFGGIAQPVVVVLSLSDGRRRAVELICGPTSFNATPPPSGDWFCSVVAPSSTAG